ncbi:LysE family transporter [Salinicola tamaricis]|uniref:LysE family transporter n=1 Tax=Salinicola tamaricis TaxID=1771309 RepID=UPI001F5CEDD6|nr:LysE family transporter [Salinicola tamaricis]
MVLATLGVTLLNPHVYLDTLVMLGLIGSQQASPPAFVAGAAMASLVWFSVWWWGWPSGWRHACATRAGGAASTSAWRW